MPWLALNQWSASMADHSDDTVIVEVRLTRAAAKQLVDQLLPPDPTLAEDLAAISEKYLSRLPADVLTRLITE
jgi:hypothetical protein